MALLDITLVLASGTMVSTTHRPTNADEKIAAQASGPPPELNRQGFPPPELEAKIPNAAPNEINNLSVTSPALHKVAKNPVTTPAMTPNDNCPNQHTVLTEVLLEL
ncbi:hypothetical protein TrRE_jg2211 [Triparma retinervis]|uniref:Uncharacterized protein n=1 Tax=Triparma retinervis TaxID=2557542 RepID=A0A9W7G929_9STRA|nr:hypothetical protein TrRE_jg2211 [Triparma retinervis]